MRHGHRKVDQPPQYGGKACPEDMEESTMCNKGDCPVCWRSSKKAVVTHTRAVSPLTAAYKASNAPTTSDTAWTDAAWCAQVPCQTTNWTLFSQCSKSCGGGLKTRTRSIISDAQNGGTPCGDLKESKICNSRPCPVDCELSNFTEFSACTATCGGAHALLSRRPCQDLRFFVGRLCHAVAEALSDVLLL